MSVKKRLKTYLRSKHITEKAFAQAIEVSPGYVSAIRQSIQPDKIQRIAINYPDLNTGWLLTGEGEMLKSDFKSDVRVAEITKHLNIPLVPIRASAGYLNGYEDQEYLESLSTIPVIVDKTYKGKYMCFEVDGDSMDDGSRYSICDKDIILGREIKRDLWINKLHIKDWNFVIVHRTEGITIKQIINHDIVNGTLTCHPVNPLYEDFTVSLNDILELYNVIKIVDRSARL